MPPAGILFYSQSCRHCAGLLAGMQRLPPAVWTRINMVCIDGRHDAIPSQIDRVPAMIIPHKNTVVFGAQLMQEVAAIASEGAQPGGQGQQQRQQQQQQQPAAPPPPAGVEPFQDASNYAYEGLGEAARDDGANLFAAPGEEIRFYGPEDEERRQRQPQQQQQQGGGGGLAEPQDTRRAPNDASQLIDRLVGQREQEVMMRAPPPGAGMPPPIDPKQPREIYDPSAGAGNGFHNHRPHIGPPGGNGYPPARIA